MQNSNKPETLAEWKEWARETLRRLGARRQDVGIDLSSESPKRSAFLQKVTLVTDPVRLTLQDHHGGTFACTYDISLTLSGLCKRFHEFEDFEDDEIETYMEAERISRDEAMAKLALRLVEAEIFAKLKAGRFLHEQLRPALEELLEELLDDAWLHAIREYGVELDDPAGTYEKIGRKHIKQRKKRSGLVRAPGHPKTWTREELLKSVNSAILEEKKSPTLRSVAKTMNYGGLSDGASALSKLLKRHSIEWKESRKLWTENQNRKRT